MHTKIQGGGGWPGGGGGQGQEKLPGGPPILSFFAFLLTSLLKFAWGFLYLPSPHHRVEQSL